MNANRRLNTRLEAGLCQSVLAPHLDALIDYFDRHGYSQKETHCQLSALVHLARWLTESNLAPCELSKGVLSRFLDDHLPQCRCPWPVVADRRTLRAAGNHLLKALREQNALKTPETNTPLEEELRRFRHYSKETCGLSSETCRNRLRYVGEFLRDRFGEAEIIISALKPDDIRTFLAEPLTEQPTVGRTTAIIDALRAYFRYRSSCGDHVQSLISAIRSPARWSMASLPRALSATEIEKLLNAFPDHLPSRRRGYAMVRCALDMGLRIGEIARLELDDIDWQNGIVTLRRNKSRREDRLPLPPTAGEAIADYLQFERPRTTLRTVFLRRFPPHDLPITVHSVRRLIRDAYQRIGLTHSRTHALRHSVAQRLLEHGSSLKEVADVLRHRSLNTSLIYAKLDTRRLQAVALPWPGGAQ